MEAGKAVVCEKPVTMNSADLQEMMDVSKNRQAFGCASNRRWDEDFLTMKKIYEEKMLGEVFAIESRVHGSREFPETGGRKGAWRRDGIGLGSSHSGSGLADDK